MWKDQTHKRYFWIAIEHDLNQLISELYEAEHEEETDIFRFDMHLESEEDLNVFNEEERNEIVGLISQLISDTKRHSRTLSRIRKFLETYKKQYKDVK